MLWLLPIIEVLATFVRNMVKVVVMTAGNEDQQRVNGFGSCIVYNPGAVLWLLPIIEVLASIAGNIITVNVAALKTEHQQSVNDFLVFEK